MTAYLTRLQSPRARSRVVSHSALSLKTGVLELNGLDCDIWGLVDGTVPGIGAADVATRPMPPRSPTRRRSLLIAELDETRVVSLA